jgi:iron complex transport system substrate-binding protein
METRIVSLIASATEIVCALGYEHLLVGRSHECDYPASILNLPACSEPRIDVSGSSAQIDQDVRETVKQVLSVYSVFEDQLDRLRPTIIITQAQCDVCAVNVRDVEAAIAEVTDFAPQVVSLVPMELADIWTDIRQVAQAIGDKAAGEKLIASLQTRLSEIREENTSDAPKPSILCVEWMEPLMSAANWVPELVDIAGGTAVLCESGQHSGYINWEDVQKADPDVIAIMPCGFDVERCQQEIHLLTERPGWSELRAVKNDRVFITDGNQYFNRPGPRVVESAQIFAELLHDRISAQPNPPRYVRLSSQ